MSNSANFVITADSTGDVIISSAAYVFAIKKNEKAKREAFELAPQSVSFSLPRETFARWFNSVVDSVIKYDPPSTEDEAQKRLDELASHVSAYFAPRLTIADLLAAVRSELSRLFPSATDVQLTRTMEVYAAIARAAAMPTNPLVAAKVRARMADSAIIKSIVESFLDRTSRAISSNPDDVL